MIRKDIEQVFRETFGDKFEDKIQVEYAFQAVNTPSKASASCRARKPLGHQYAVLVARQLIHEPFAVINADDYGISGFGDMARFLKTIAPIIMR